MSDDTFDDSLLEDYDVGKSSPSLEFDKKKFLPEPSLKKGLLIAILLTILLELGVGLALDVQGNLVHRYIAYMLGLLPIFVAAIYTRSVLKMFFIGAPIIIITSFALPFFLPNVFSGLMTPFLSLLPIVARANKLLINTGNIDANTQQIFDAIQQYGIALDFFFGIFVGLFAAIGLTAIVKLFSNKLGLLSVFTFTIGGFFLILGVIVLPYLLVILSGVAQFTMTFGVGGAVLARGTQVATSNNGSLSDANALFAEAKQWFEQAEAMLQGMQSLGLFNILGATNPNVKVIVDNGIVLMNAAVDLAKGIAPALAGFTTISKGINEAMAALDNSSQNVALFLAQENQSNFDKGIELIEQGFQNFTQAVPNLRDAINTINTGVDRKALTDALATQGLNATEPMAFIFSALPLLDTVLSVFTNPNKTGLIDDPDGVVNNTQRSPMIHLILAAKSMSEAQGMIGENSDFKGTGTSFSDMIYHLDFLVNALNSDTNPAIANLENLQLESDAPSAIVNLKEQLTGTVNFLKDAGNTTISIGRFGIVASPTLTAMNSTITFLTSSGDFTSLPDSEYQNAINYFDGNDTINPGITSNATKMQSLARDVRSQIDDMEVSDYGFFNGTRSGFVTQFRAFNLTKNADNFKYISSGLASTVKAMKELTKVDAVINRIDGNSTIVRTEIGYAQGNVSIPDLATALTSVTNAQTAVGNIKTDIIVANDTLQIGRGHITNASISFNKTVDMPQMLKTSDALVRISVKMRNIQVGDANSTQFDLNGLTGISHKIGNIEGNVTQVESLANGGDTNAANYASFFTNISNDLTGITNEISYITTQFAGIQTDLRDISIAA